MLDKQSADKLDTLWRRWSLGRNVADSGGKFTMTCHRDGESAEYCGPLAEIVGTALRDGAERLKRRLEDAEKRVAETKAELSKVEGGVR